MTRIIHSNRKQGWTGLLCGFVLVAFGLGPTTSCRDPRVAAELPSGAWVYADAAAARAILESLESLRDTPMADASSALRERIADCRDVVAHADTGDLSALLGQTRCASSAEVPASVAALRGDAAMGFALEVAPGNHLAGRLVRSDDGSLRLEANMALPADSNVGALVIPDDEPPGVPSLSEAETLLHARMRPRSGLNIASLVSEDSQADNMFRLRSELFLGQVLEGTWEVAIYLPRVDQVTPPMALALDYSLRPAAKAAMDTFVAELESTWPIHHSPAMIGGLQGECFHDVKLLPDLAPCYVLTDRSIVIGWNATSLDLALSDESQSSRTGLGEEGGLLFHLGRLPEADLRLQRQLMGGVSARKLDYVWDELRVRGANRGSTLEVTASLEMDGAS